MESCMDPVCRPAASTGISRLSAGNGPPLRISERAADADFHCFNSPASRPVVACGDGVNWEDPPWPKRPEPEEAEGVIASIPQCVLNTIVGAYDRGAVVTGDADTGCALGGSSASPPRRRSGMPRSNDRFDPWSSAGRRAWVSSATS
jgi:hypothetical protein